jgi:cysteine synthase A
MGPTSGAAWLVAQWKARLEPDNRVVVLLPDEGHRYQDTVYDDDWLRAGGHLRAELPAEPTAVGTPAAPGGPWSTYPWQRRAYADVLGQPREVTQHVG